MRPAITVAFCSTMISLSAVAFAETPVEIFTKMESMKHASYQGIDDYSEMKTTMGMCSIQHYEKESTQAAGGSVEYMRLVPISEVMERKNPDSPFAQSSPEDLEYAATRLREQGPALDSAMDTEMTKAGVPPMLGEMVMNPPPDQPWLSPKPGDMLNNYATMLEAAAEGKRDIERIKAEQEAGAKMSSDAVSFLGEMTKVVGKETVNGRPAIHLVAEDLNFPQSSGDSEFLLKTMHLWVDSEHYVPLKLEMDGIATSDGESRKMRIEREDQAYRTVEGCGSMYEPQRTVMRIAGVLSPKEEAQMKEAQQKLAEFKTQMAAMPQAQQDMIRSRMGPQMEMMEKMAAGGGIEVVSLSVGMKCNAGLPTQKEYMQTVPGVSQGACIGFVGD
jgi:hypothetical protein